MLQGVAGWCRVVQGGAWCRVVQGEAPCQEVVVEHVVGPQPLLQDLPGQGGTRLLIRGKAACGLGLAQCFRTQIGPILGLYEILYFF